MATSVSREGRKNKVDMKYVAREKETTLKASLAVNYISPRNSKFGKGLAIRRAALRIRTPGFLICRAGIRRFFNLFFNFFFSKLLFAHQTFFSLFQLFFSIYFFIFCIIGMPPGMLALVGKVRASAF